MKNKIYFLIIFVFFMASMATAIYLPSKDNFSNMGKGFENRKFFPDEIRMEGWDGNDSSYIAKEGAKLILDDLGCFVHTIRISGQIVPNPSMMKIYYTMDTGDESNERSKIVSCGINGENVCIIADITAKSLVLDFSGVPGTEVKVDEIEINDMSPVLSINYIAKFCLLPTMAFGGVIFLIFYRINPSIYLRNLKKYLPLVGNLISRDLKVKYRRSVLGFLWSILNPLLMALVINAVFSKIFRFQVDYFATYYLTGSLVFNFMVEATSNALMSVIGAAPLIRKVYIPKYIFPLQKCAFAFVNMLFGGVAVVVVMLIQGVPFHMTALLFPVPMLCTFVFSYGLGLILAAFTVYFRDIQHLYSVFTSIWMYMTPIIYPEEVLLSSSLGIVMKLNPMYYFTHSFRSLVMYGQLPAVNENIMCIVFALLALICGLAVFKKLQDKFILYI